MADNRRRGGGRHRRRDDAPAPGKEPAGPFQAPFRFARVNRWIYEPDWAPLAGHDAPFADGVCGEAEVEITAKSAILVGGEQRQPDENSEGEVHPFRLPDGAYAIPGSALQGMARAILEVAAFGRLGPWVEDRRFGIRDLTSTETAKQHYRRRLLARGGSKAGWLCLRDERPVVVPCRIGRIHLDDVREFKRALSGGGNIEDAVLYDRTDAKARYEWLLQGVEGGVAALDARFSPAPGEEPTGAGHPRYRHDPHGNIEGTLVLTGKPQQTRKSRDRSGVTEFPRGHKRLEFVFHTPGRAAAARDAGALAVPDDAWRAFELLHKEQRGRPANPNREFWKDEFAAGRPVPVFYWIDEDDNERIDTLGMAFAFKAAHVRSARDLLEHSCPGHVDKVAEMKLDLPHLLFGVAAEHDGGLGLKRRARFGLARADGGPRPEEPAHPSILLGPKPGYVGFYIRQEGKDGRVSGREPMATYTPLEERPWSAKPHLARPELAGVKIWPARGAGAFRPEPVKPELAENRKVQTRLFTLPPGTVFRSRLVFHNLRVVELGALLWALSFGDEAAFGADPDAIGKRHRLGMGKPLGLGEVAIRVAGLTTEPACPGRAPEIPPDAIGFVRAFEKHMRGAYGGKWRESKQVKALLKAAAPTGNAAELRYMMLDDYREHKKRQAYLDDYADGDEKPRGAASGGGAGAAAPPGDTPPAADLPLVEGARVRGKAGTQYSGREGIVVKVGRSEYDRCVVKFENAPRAEALRPALFHVIGLPGDAGAG